jgi:hypothetical protein
MGFLDRVKNIFNPNAPEEEPVQNWNGLAFRNAEEAVSYGQKEYDRRKKERLPIELQWVLNMNFLMGNQFCDIDPNRNMITQIDRQFDYEERKVYDQMSSIYEARLAKLVKFNPQPIARPQSNDAKDIATAEVSTKVAKGVDTKECMRDKNTDALAWLGVCGAVFRKHIWNDKDGRPIGIFDQTGEEVFEGDINKIVVNAFEILPRSLFAQGIENQRDVIHAKAYSTEDIEEKWGKKIKAEEVDIFTLSQSNKGVGGLA